MKMENNNENGELIRNTHYGTSGASFTTEIDISSYLPYSIIRKGNAGSA